MIFLQKKWVQTGSLFKDFFASGFYTVSNLCAYPFNAVSNLVNAPYDVARHYGASEEDLQALDFALLMTGISEVKIGMGEASELLSYSRKIATIEKVVQEEKVAQTIFTSTFAETEEIMTVWKRAAKGRLNTSEGFASARRSFWRMVNKGKDPETKTIQRLLTEAGYELQGGTRAPLNELVPNAPISDKLLSIDHIIPKSLDPSKTLDPNNLILLPLRDNAQKGTFIIDYYR